MQHTGSWLLATFFINYCTQQVDNIIISNVDVIANLFPRCHQHYVLLSPFNSISHFKMSYISQVEVALNVISRPFVLSHNYNRLEMPVRRDTSQSCLVHFLLFPDMSHGKTFSNQWYYEHKVQLLLLPPRGLETVSFVIFHGDRFDFQEFRARLESANSLLLPRVLSVRIALADATTNPVYLGDGGGSVAMAVQMPRVIRIQSESVLVHCYWCSCTSKSMEIPHLVNLAHASPTDHIEDVFRNRLRQFQRCAPFLVLGQSYTNITVGHLNEKYETLDSTDEKSIVASAIALLGDFENATVWSTKDVEFYTMWSHKRFQVVVPSVDYNGYLDRYVAVETTCFRFATCSVRSSDARSIFAVFRPLFKPFSWTVWLIVAIQISVSWLLNRLLTKLSPRNSRTDSKFPFQSSQVHLDIIIGISLSSCMIFSSVITYVFDGSLTALVASPVPLDFMNDMVEDVYKNGLTIFTSMVSEGELTGTAYDIPNFFDYPQAGDIAMYSAFGDRLAQLYSLQTRTPEKYRQMNISTLFRQTRLIESPSSLKFPIDSCNKSVYMDLDEKIDEFLLMNPENSRGIKFHKNTQCILPETKSWGFSNILHGKYLMRRMSSLLTSGILNFLQRKIRMERIHTKYKARMAKSGSEDYHSVGLIMAICGTGYGLALGFFLLEIIQKYAKDLLCTHWCFFGRSSNGFYDDRL